MPKLFFDEVRDRRRTRRITQGAELASMENCIGHDGASRLTRHPPTIAQAPPSGCSSESALIAGRCADPFNPGIGGSDDKGTLKADVAKKVIVKGAQMVN